MIVGGIDVGSLNISLVVLQDSSILYSKTVRITGKVQEAADKIMKAALEVTGLTGEELKYVVSTGRGKAAVALAREQRPEGICLGKGAHWLYPEATAVLCIGAESSVALLLDTNTGTMKKIARNDKCASGLGGFLDTMANVMHISLGEMGELALKASRKQNIDSTCAVFAESEVISYIHTGVPKEEIMAGIIDLVVQKAIGLLYKLGINGDVVLAGGVAKNPATLKIAEETIGKRVIVPPKPQIIGALGAALIAQEKFSQLASRGE